MELSASSTAVLQEIPIPAFTVRSGIIFDANAAAQQQGVQNGSAIETILFTGAIEYSTFSSGRLYLTLKLSGTLCGASVTKGPDYDLFLLEQEEDAAELQSMALAAQALRAPLSNVMTVADRLFPLTDTGSSEVREQAARINKGLYQMLRIISNMSDAYRYAQDNAPKMEIRDIRAIMEELFQQHASLIHHTDINLHFENLPSSVFCLVDAEKLERAVGNILSNALKFTPKGGTIEAKLTRVGRMLHLTVQDSGTGIPENLQGNVYNHFQRQPGIEDGRFGIGLGMVLIRSAATIHGGTVLIDQPEHAGTRVTMTLAIRQDADAIVRSSIISVDYAGGRDHGLLELADNLPMEFYYPENLE